MSLINQYSDLLDSNELQRIKVIHQHSIKKQNIKKNKISSIQQKLSNKQETTDYSNQSDNKNNENNDFFVNSERLQTYNENENENDNDFLDFENQNENEIHIENDDKNENESNEDLKDMTYEMHGRRYTTTRNDRLGTNQVRFHDIMTERGEIAETLKV